MSPWSEKVEEENLLVCQQLKYRRYTKFKNFAEFSKYYHSCPVEEQCFYEMMREDQGRKPYFDIDIDDEIYVATGIRIDEIEFSANYPDHANPLNGSWLMSGIERRGEMRMRDVNRPRKTLKMLAGGRFQWIAYDTSKKGFYCTGGGTFTAVDGKYIENLEFFSRDSNTVGKSLDFDYEIKEGDWHHKGFSSKGDPKYEIWTKRKQ